MRITQQQLGEESERYSVVTSIRRLNDWFDMVFVDDAIRCEWRAVSPVRRELVETNNNAVWGCVRRVNCGGWLAEFDRSGLYAATIYPTAEDAQTGLVAFVENYQPWLPVVSKAGRYVRPR